MTVTHPETEQHSLVQAEAARCVLEILLRELPVFNGSFHESRHHDEAQDQDVDTREDLVDHGRLLHAQGQQSCKARQQKLSQCEPRARHVLLGWGRGREGDLGRIQAASDLRGGNGAEFILILEAGIKITKVGGGAEQSHQGWPSRSPSGLETPGQGHQQRRRRVGQRPPRARPPLFPNLHPPEPPSGAGFHFLQETLCSDSREGESFPEEESCAHC